MVQAWWTKLQDDKDDVLVPADGWNNVFFWTVLCMCRMERMLV